MRLFSRALFGALAMSACASPRAAIPVELDPSNPDAPEAASPLLSNTLRPESADAGPLFTASFDAGVETQVPTQRATQPRPPVPDAKRAVVYTCPMHPEVIQPGPGQCPKCGMNLVVRSGGP